MAISKEELRDALTRNGYTAASFAETWGVHPDTVYRWGNGATPRWVMTVLNLMDQLGRERIERCGGRAKALQLAAHRTGGSGSRTKVVAASIKAEKPEA